MKLSPEEIDVLANCICGGEGTSIEYRTATSINRFRAFVGAKVDWETGSSRFYDAVAYLEACNETQPGRSGLPQAIEKVVVALVDRRQFKSHAAQDEVLEQLSKMLEVHQGELRLDVRRRVDLISSTSSPGQEILNDEIHTIFEKLVRDPDLDAAREHYRKARRFLNASDPDFANAAKEGVCAVESLLGALTGERDFNKAVGKAVAGSGIPRPLGELIKKLYAYRGDAPGVAHAGLPEADQEDAQFVVNLAAAIGLYLRGKLTRV